MLRASKTQIKGDYVEVVIHDWRGRVRKKLLPREGWEELEPGFYMLSRTRLWLHPLFLLRKKRELVAYEGLDVAKAARRESGEGEQ